eukprot:Filipodium_phascolosomae@DN3578_c0_g1_i1.p1
MYFEQAAYIPKIKKLFSWQESSSSSSSSRPMMPVIPTTNNLASEELVNAILASNSNGANNDGLSQAEMRQMQGGAIVPAAGGEEYRSFAMLHIQAAEKQSGGATVNVISQSINCKSGSRGDNSDGNGNGSSTLTT